MISFDVAGSGPPVVLLHGHPFDRTLWQAQRSPLVDAGYSVVIPDLRGYGQSPATGSVVTMGELAGDVAELLLRLDARHPTVIGLSMGGLVAMELAVHGPTRHGLAVGGVGLVATTAQPVTPEERQRREDAATAAEHEGMAPLVRQMVEGGLFVPGCPPAIIETVTAMMMGNNPQGCAAALRGRAVRPDYRPGLTGLRIPAWVCVGTADPWSTPAVTEELVGCLAAPEVTVLPEVGHLPNLEEPAAFNQALLAFLQRTSPTD